MSRYTMELIDEQMIDSIYDFARNIMISGVSGEQWLKDNGYGSLDDWKGCDGEVISEMLSIKEKEIPKNHCFRLRYVDDGNCGHFIIEEWEITDNHEYR